MVNYSEEQLCAMSPKEFREIVRKGKWTDVTTGVCRGYAQASLAIVPKDLAFEFLLFCNRNPKPCPLLDVTEPGDPHPKLMAPEADLRTDLPRYSVIKDGEIIDEPTNITKYWRDDLVGFLLGCGLSVVWALKAANLSWRRYAGYRTTIPCTPAGHFRGHTVVGVRAFYNAHDAVRAIQISSRHPLFHGGPVYIGNPADIGIKNLGKPDPFFHGRPDVEPPKPGEIVMYWAGAVTPLLVAIESKIPFMITHCPTHEFLTDWLLEELAIL